MWHSFSQIWSIQVSLSKMLYVSLPAHPTPSSAKSIYSSQHTKLLLNYSIPPLEPSMQQDLLSFRYRFTTIWWCLKRDKGHLTWCNCLFIFLGTSMPLLLRLYFDCSWHQAITNATDRSPHWPITTRQRSRRRRRRRRISPCYLPKTKKLRQLISYCSLPHE